MDNGLKILLIAGGVAVTLVVLTLVFNITSSGQDVAAENMNNMYGQMDQLSDNDAKVYDGSLSSGSTVMSAIRTLSDKYTIIVLNKTAGAAITDPEAPTITQVNAAKSATNTYENGATYSSLTNPDPIVKTGDFCGTVLYDANGAVKYVVFVQK